VRASLSLACQATCRQALCQVRQHLLPAGELTGAQVQVLQVRFVLQTCAQNTCSICTCAPPAQQQLISSLCFECKESTTAGLTRVRKCRCCKWSAPSALGSICRGRRTLAAPVLALLSAYQQLISIHCAFACMALQLLCWQERKCRCCKSLSPFFGGKYKRN